MNPPFRGTRFVLGGSRSGVSLTELMIAAAVMSMGVMGLIATFAGIQKGIQISKNKTLAANLAQEKMHILKQKTYYQVIPTPAPSGENTEYSPSIPYDTVYFPPEDILEGGVRYQRLTYVQVIRENSGTLEFLPPETPDTGMRMITVTVLWRDSGSPRKLSINSILANPNTVMASAVFQGYVRKASGFIPGALVNVAENMGWRDTANASGLYSISLSPGNFTLMASAPGYYSQFLAVSVGAGATVNQDFTLVPIGSGTVTGTAWVSPGLLISQVVVDTYTFCNDGNEHDVEYVELFNPTTAAIYLGTTGQAGWLKDVALFYLSEGGAHWAYEQGNVDGNGSFNLQYANTSVPARSYFLISNADRFMINGAWVTADATYHPLYSQQMGLYPDKAGYVGLIDWTPVWTGIDSVRWDSSTSGVGGAPNWTSNLSTVSIPNCCGNTALGLPKGNQLVRISSPSAGAADIAAFGRAYNYRNNQTDFLYPSAGFSGLPYTPRSVADGAFTLVAGVPAVGAVVSANDGLSDPTTAYLTGSPPRAVFSLTNVATGTWMVLISSGQYLLENDTVTLANSGSVYTFSSSTTLLNQPALYGFVSGTVVDAAGAPISVPQAIPVSPGPAGSNQNASATTGRYLLVVTTGSVDVTANVGNGNPNYISVSSSVEVGLGRVSSGVNFVLSQGGRLSGFVTRDGVNALPGVAVAAIDLNGLSRDQQVSDVNGRFTTVNIATGTYSATPSVDSLETSSPTARTAVVLAGQTVFAGTFTITGALGAITGSVTSGGAGIATGVLIVVTTATLSGSPPAPPALSTNTLASGVYYVASSREDGTYSVEVRQSTSPAYRVYGYYTTLSSTGAVTISAQSLTGVQVTAGQTVSGQDLSW